MPELVRDEKLQHDQRLVRAAAAGDEAACERLVRELWPRVRRLTHHLCGGAAEAEDLCQEAMVQILQAVCSYRAEGCVEAWADRITVRTVLKRRRRSRRLEAFLSLDLDEAQVPGLHGEVVALGRERQRQVQRLLERLDPQRRAALLLKLAHGLSVKEVANSMDLTPATVRYLLKSGRRQLRRYLSRDPSTRETLGLQEDPT